MIVRDWYEAKKPTLTVTQEGDPSIKPPRNYVHHQWDRTVYDQVYRPLEGMVLYTHYVDGKIVEQIRQYFHKNQPDKILFEEKVPEEEYSYI